jgi:circadian clock protein KaiC
MQKTGIEGLDAVLGGGIPIGDLLFVVGSPGSGKTTLVAQAAFHAARAGQRAVFASTTSEPAARLVKHLRGFSFWNDAAVSRAISFESIFPVAREGTDELVNALVQSVQSRKASLLILDGYCTLRDLHPDSPKQRSFISELASAVAALDCTTLVTSSHVPPEQGPASAEFTMCDGIVQLSEQDTEGRSQRTIRVRKTRGVASLLGAHTLRITTAGLAVYPRIETYTIPVEHNFEVTPLSLGCPELDQMTSGGLPRGSSTIIVGAPGTGKTVLALQFLIAGAQRGERGVLLSFRESRAQLVRKARTLGLDLETPLADGRIRLLRYPAIDVEADQVLAALWRELAQSDATRIACDSIVELERSLSEGRKRRALAAVIENLRTRGLTVLLVHDHAPVDDGDGEIDYSGSPLQVLAENVILLRYRDVGGNLARMVSVLKMRDAAHEHASRQYQLAGEGLRVFPRPSHAEKLPHQAPSAPLEQLVDTELRPAKPEAP